MNPIPLLFHPTKTVILDDESSFLEHLEVGLEGEIDQVQFFGHPQKAMSFVTENAISGLSSEDWIYQKEDEQEPEQCVLSIQIQDLHKNMRDLNRFSQVSTVVVDYHMGSTNGLEWCQKISNPLIQKILLTGVADEQVGIEALNNGWIQQYVRKQDPQMLTKLIQTINRAKRNCFSRLTSGLHFAITQTPEDTSISDPTFVNYFWNLVETQRIVEFYLFETMGSFLLVDADGNRRCLFVQTKAKAESNIRLLEDSISPNESKNSLITLEKIICCPSTKSFVTPSGVNFERYLFSAQKLMGQQMYHLALTPDLIGEGND